MRVTYVCTDAGIPVFGRKGASIHVQELLRAYRRLGHDVTLATNRRGGEPPADLRSVPVIDVPLPEDADPAARERARREIDAALEADLVARGGVDLVHERYSLWGGAGVRAAARLGVPSVLEANAPLIEEQAAYRTLADRPGAKAQLVAMLRVATAVVAVSEPVAAWVRGYARAGLEVAVVANGVDAERITPGDRRDPATFTVGFTGTLKPWHGVDVLVSAVAILSRRVATARLLIVGDGPMREAVAEAAARAGVPLELTGSIDHDDVARQLHRMDVACAPYPPDADTYFSPLKVLEYLAAGIPVVASRVGQIPELLDEGRCGWLVPPGDPVALADALARLAADPAERLELGRRGRERAVERYSWTDVARRTVAAAGIGRTWAGSTR